MSEQKVLVFDVETAPIEAYVWGTRDQNIALNQIKNDWYVIAWAAKWLGEPGVFYHDQSNVKRLSDDRLLLKSLWYLLDQADIVITQNGTKFDSRKLNARFIMHGMKPPSPYKHLDTYQILSRVADFTSDKLEYYTDKLCKKYKKLSHKKFPGMELWTECLKGNKKAWAEMKKYNIHDVLATEELYMTVKAWTPQTAPAVFTGLTNCRVCGSSRLHQRGFVYNRASKFKKAVCLDCGAWTLSKRIPL